MEEEEKARSACNRQKDQSLCLQILRGPPYRPMSNQERKILQERKMEYVNDLDCHGTDYTMRPWAFATAKKVAESLKEKKDHPHEPQLNDRYRTHSVLETPSFVISGYKGTVSFVFVDLFQRNNNNRQIVD